MNILSMIFSVLLALTIAMGAIFEKQLNQHKIRSSYVGHFIASRKILSSHQSKSYASIKHIPKPKKASSLAKKEKEKEEVIAPPETNPLCARLNIYPLVEEKKELHPQLFLTFKNLIASFYRESLFFNDLKAEKSFIDAFFKTLHKSLRESKGVSLEKLSFELPEHRRIYYKMLKGTKECDLFQKKGYPSLLEYLSFTTQDQRPCIKHAHPHLLSIFFGKKTAQELYKTLHQKNAPPLTIELIENVLSSTHFHFFDKELLSLVDLSNPRCEKDETLNFTGKDVANNVSLKKTLSL